jgi:hypothetical protein
MQDEQFPKVGQKFFVPGLPPEAYLSPSGDLKDLDLLDFILLYVEAGNVLLKCVTEIWPNEVVLPMLFCFRHAAELTLKAVLSAEAGTFVDKHGLFDLWVSSAKFFDRHYPEETIKAVGELVLELDLLDPGSYSFRYPVDIAKKHRAPLLKDDPSYGSSFSVSNFSTVAQAFGNFLRDVVCVLSDMPPKKEHSIAMTAGACP